MDWSQLVVAPEGTYHLRGQLPVYVQRFDRVQKFHEPGLAPVVSAGLAWHIRPTGEPVYIARYLQSFGFYGGFAAVQGNVGWFHITPDGQPLYGECYSWCGNFQEGLCMVRLLEGRYTHVGTDGRGATDCTWRYAGDYRDGVAVVQRDNGLSSHINRQGELLHNRWFLDLDVFHKGYARAKDEAGWFHVRRDGSAAYTRRFVMAEPFYNGQARVETHDGALEVIDEIGVMQVELRESRNRG